MDDSLKNKFEMHDIENIKKDFKKQFVSLKKMEI